MKRETKICIICGREGNEDSLRFGPWGKKCINCKDKKRCYICKEIKELNQYTKDSSRTDSCSNKCKDCSKEIEKVRIRYTTEESRQKRREYERNRSRTRRKTSIGRIREVFKTCLKKLNRKKTNSTFKTLGFTKEQFQLKFPVIPEGYDIDHCIPLSWFEDTTPIKISCAIPNLQILKSSVNNSKRNFYCDKPSDDQYITNCLPFIKKEYVARVKNFL